MLSDPWSASLLFFLLFGHMQWLSKHMLQSMCCRKGLTDFPILFTLFFILGGFLFFFYLSLLSIHIGAHQSIQLCLNELWIWIVHNEFTEKKEVYFLVKISPLGLKVNFPLHTVDIIDSIHPLFEAWWFGFIPLFCIFIFYLYFFAGYWKYFYKAASTLKKIYFFFLHFGAFAFDTYRSKLAKWPIPDCHHVVSIYGHIKTFCSNKEPQIYTKNILH